MSLFNKVLAGSAAGSRAVAVGVNSVYQALPGFASVFGAGPVSAPVATDDLSHNEITARINDSDRAHMNAFPADKKAQVMTAILSATSMSNEQCAVR